MRTFTRTLLAAALLPACSAAAATSTLDISGTLRVSPCSITITEQDKLAFGVIDYNDLKPSDSTPLPAVTLPAALTCPADTHVQMSFIDNMESTTQREVFHIEDNAKPGKQAGWYIVRLMDGVNGGSSEQIFRFDGPGAGEISDQAWANRRGSGMGFIRAVKTASFNINVAPHLLSQAAFSATDKMNLRGSLTINLVYP